MQVMFFFWGGAIFPPAFRVWIIKESIIYCLKSCSENLHETATYTDLLGRTDFLDLHSTFLKSCHLTGWHDFMKCDIIRSCKVQTICRYSFLIFDKGPNSNISLSNFWLETKSTICVILVHLTVSSGRRCKFKNNSF